MHFEFIPLRSFKEEALLKYIGNHSQEPGTFGSGGLFRGISSKDRHDLVILPISGWKKLVSEEEVDIWGASNDEDMTGLVNTLSGNLTDPERLQELFMSMNGHFAVVVRTRGFLLAAVDKNRSIPIFYRLTASGLALGNCARALAEEPSNSVLDRKAIQEIRLTGYALGTKTAVKGLNQLLPGQFLLWSDQETQARLERYYCYLPYPDHKTDEKSLQLELAYVTDKVFHWAAEVAHGRPIFVPLSGGLDSRLVLCKLHELGYRNLHAYSYGVPGNHEVRVARTVARRLGISWEFVPVTPRTCRSFFWGSHRKAYWRLADGLSSVPVLQDVAVLKKRVEKGDIPRDAVFINGQSGDYITGGHVPASLISSNVQENDLLKALIAKHFSLWSHLQTPDRLRLLREILREQLDELRQCSADNPTPAALYETWEWQERQCKYVVNGVRMYDFAGLDWLMPLWHGSYLDFWKKVPYALKHHQRLYKKYLESWDYAGLFKGFSPNVWRWPGATMAVLPVAFVLGRVGGPAAKEWFYRRARYFGHYRFAYGLYEWKDFLNRTDSARNPVSFMAETWVRELEAEAAAGGSQR